MTPTACRTITAGRGRGRRATAALLLLAGAAASLALATAPGAATVTASSCAATGLVAWLDTQADGAAGSSYYQLRFTNLSGHACTLLGYPGVSAVDLRGRQVGSAATRDTSRAVPRVTLANGTTAPAALRIVTADNYPTATCRQATAAGLRVYPPGATRATIIPFPFRACSLSGPVVLQVGAIRNS